MYSIFKCDIVNPGMKRDKYHSIAQRISFLFLILMIPVFLLFCLMLYIQFHYQNEASDELFVTRASNMAEMLEGEFDDINSACMDFLYDEELVRLASDLVYKTDYDLMKDYEAVMDLITRANWEQMEEEKKMCDALKELFADELKEADARGRAEGMQHGIERGKIEGIRLAKQILSLHEQGNTEEQIAEICGLSAEQVREILE